MMKDIILLGGGGHCSSVIDSIASTNRYNIIGILDQKQNVGTYVQGIKIIGDDDDLLHYFNQGVKHAFVTTGSIGDCSLRIKLVNLLKRTGFKLPPIIDSTAVIANSAKIGDGTFVGKRATLNTNVVIGDNCIINTATVIEHDTSIDSFCHIAPGTIISGGVSIHRETHIGTNSTIIQNIDIGHNTIIGAGSVVVKDIGSNKKAFGNPCKEVL